MKNFHSKFEKLKQVKQLQERKIQQKLAQFLLKEKWFAQRLVSLEQEMDRSFQQLILARQKGILVQQHTLREYLTQLEEAFVQITNTLETLQIQRLELQQQLQNHHQKRKVIEKIYQGHYTSWRRDMLKYDA
ncbi:MAG: hypothetical protein JSS62_04120 [Verrucomicrobia bacterium]|nr:hypothetical protein [Verrucomicrobiota bacterium]MBS0645496.1 hypothetical protein [Verrucomicrobiota bacterium]